MAPIACRISCQRSESDHLKLIANDGAGWKLTLLATVKCIFLQVLASLAAKKNVNGLINAETFKSR